MILSYVKNRKEVMYKQGITRRWRNRWIWTKGLATPGVKGLATPGVKDISGGNCKGKSSRVK